MSDRPGAHAPAHYELRIAGHLDEHWSAWFGGLTLVRNDDGTTTLRGAVADQAELHGLLAKIRDLGAPLLAVSTSDLAVHPTELEGSQLSGDGARPAARASPGAARQAGRRKQQSPR